MPDLNSTDDTYVHEENSPTLSESEEWSFVRIGLAVFMIAVVIVLLAMIAV